MKIIKNLVNAKEVIIYGAGNIARGGIITLPVDILKKIKCIAVSNIEIINDISMCISDIGKCGVATMGKGYN